MEMRTKTLAMLSVVLVAVIAGSVIFALQSTVSAADDSADEVESTPSATVIYNDSFNSGQMMFAMEPRFDMGHRGGMGRDCYGFGANSIQVSDEYVANITSIAESDSDVQDLISQGYNITSVHPVINTVIDGNGNLVTKASTANVTLEGTNGIALVVVDLDQAKVTKIVTHTVTEINK